MPPSIVLRLFKKANAAYREYRFQATELHVHPVTFEEIRHVCLNTEHMWEARITPAGVEDYVHTPVGPLRVLRTETVPPDSLQLRRPDPRRHREPIEGGRREPIL